MQEERDAWASKPAKSGGLHYGRTRPLFGFLSSNFAARLCRSLGSEEDQKTNTMIYFI